jgi:hypothetical protein
MSKPATEAQRREARKLIHEAWVQHKRDIEAKHTTPAHKPSGAEILKVLKSGKIKLRSTGGDACRCPSLYTQLGDLIDFGQREERTDEEAVAKARVKLDAAKAKAVATITLGDVAADKLLPVVEAFRTARF